MSFTDLLISTATISRYTAGTADAYGVGAKTWANHLTAQPCRLSYVSGRQIQRGTEVVPVEALLFTGVIDVTEADRAVVDSVTWEILFVAARQDGTANHHLEIGLKRVKP